MEATECGAAALGMILAYYGRYAPLTQLRRDCGVSRDGSKASNILKAARRYGLAAKGYSKTLQQLPELKPPFIIFWQFNHFLVVEGFSRKFVYLNDPDSGHCRVLWRDFDRSFTGVVLVMEPGPEFTRGGRPRRVWPGIWKRFVGNRAALALCAAAGLFLVIPGLAIPAFTRVFLDAIVLDAHYNWLRPLLVAMLITVVLQFLLSHIQLAFMRRLKISLTARTKSQFFWHLLRLPIDFYSQRYPGEVVERSELNDEVAELLTQDLVKAGLSLFTMAVYAIALLFYDVLLASIGIAFAVGNLWVLRRVSLRRIEANMKASQDEGKVQATVIAGLSSIDSIKASGSEDGFFAKWSGHYARGSNARVQLETSNASVNVMPGALNFLATICVLVVGGLRVMDGSITVGMLVAIQLLMDSFLSPVEMLVQLGGRIQELHGSLNRLDDVLEQDTDPLTSRPRSDLQQLRDQAVTRLQGFVELRDVSFGYNPLDRPLISELNLKIEPGQRVALVGGSGSGKSTAAKLICGFYMPWSGEILFDGIGRDDLPRAALCCSLGLVEQDVFLFEGTVRDNLTLWDSTVGDSELWTALSDAAIDDAIANLPGGLDAVFLEGGANLSGGQRQRIEIARALVTNPSILVLDEATSALDTETERIIDENLRRRGCTMIIVAHRLSTIRDCDEIIVFEYGRVVERGTHQQLWEMRGVYYELLRLSDQQTELLVEA